MSKLKITQGTWLADVTRIIVGNIQLFNQEWWDSHEEMEEAKANATLAAAAPELYRMLEKLLMAAKTANEINVVKIHNSLIHDVEETLKEARGEK
ncbi:MAG: hypothetical protein IJU61_06000 [Victivallales bacterium]|nr:hypothetical protein [Bacteroidales bacterium]MBQ9446126.1 hypothetical protein [Victivallales bacterium]